jgi:hypothetical protein
VNHTPDGNVVTADGKLVTMVENAFLLGDGGNGESSSRTPFVSLNCSGTKVEALRVGVFFTEREGLICVLLAGALSLSLSRAPMMLKMNDVIEHSLSSRVKQGQE